MTCLLICILMRHDTWTSVSSLAVEDLIYCCCSTSCPHFFLALFRWCQCFTFSCWSSREEWIPVFRDEFRYTCLDFSCCFCSSSPFFASYSSFCVVSLPSSLASCLASSLPSLPSLLLKTLETFIAPQKSFQQNLSMFLRSSCSLTIEYLSFHLFRYKKRMLKKRLLLSVPFVLFYRINSLCWI